VNAIEDLRELQKFFPPDKFPQSQPTFLSLLKGSLIRHGIDLPRKSRAANVLVFSARRFSPPPPLFSQFFLPPSPFFERFTQMVAVVHRYASHFFEEESPPDGTKVTFFAV